MQVGAREVRGRGSWRKRRRIDDGNLFAGSSGCLSGERERVDFDGGESAGVCRENDGGSEERASGDPLATLWLGLEARPILLEGAQIYWKERREWWTVQGRPLVFSEAPGAHLEAVISANQPDGLFEEAQPALPLSRRFTNAETMTGVRLDVATNADFSETILTASSVLSATGWLYANGSQWMRIPAGGLPPQSLQTVAYIPSLELPGGNYFARWTPFYGTLAGVGMAAQVAL